ncbi:zinc-dependent alcohol dehydrogenase [Neomoorella mulderi]|uniref:Sorbitol dehydrogenase n=1 Tax=Moorella mulderi DSM 14980 TaxID=1122241 RepID=A0A151ATT6_9FIRM|nr:alcohol dehydrogenase catalytic domain-containing protein [Moorella mulderi]KYH31035.1 sorbitol dehydrogenase [Moorella mulderi DSM 14980]
MRAAVLQAPYKIVIENVPEPKPADGEVLIKVKAAGICGSDLHAYEGIHPRRRPPAILGHEVIGVIVEVGKRVRKFKVGDRVTVLPRKNCGACPPCVMDWSNLCDHKILLGTNEWAGGFAEYIVAPEETIYTIPDVLDDIVGSLVEPLAVGVHVIERGEVRRGEKVAILGAGPIGLMCVACAHRAGADHIVVADLVDFRLSAAKRLGANVVVNSAKDCFLSKMEEACGLTQVDVAIIAAGAPVLLNEAFSIVRKKGRIILVGQFDIPDVIDIEKSRLKEQTLVGSSTYCKEDFLDAIKILEINRDQFELLVTHQIPLEEIEKGIDLIRKRDQDVLKVIVKF